MNGDRSAWVILYEIFIGSVFKHESFIHASREILSLSVFC